MDALQLSHEIATYMQSNTVTAVGERSLLSAMAHLLGLDPVSDSIMHHTAELKRSRLEVKACELQAALANSYANTL